MEQVSFVITSSNRFDLLERTLDSFLALNKYPIAKFILNEDSGNVECMNKILAKYGNRFHILFHPQREGLSCALDNLMRLVETEYVFTCEDDWLFEGNQNFISQSMKILERNQNIHQVWIRDQKDHSHPLGPVQMEGGSTVRKVLKGYKEHWGGFTFNPSLRRMSDYKMFFTRGFSEFGDEIECSKHVNERHYTAVSLCHHACKHIGWGRHTEDFKV